MKTDTYKAITNLSIYEYEYRNSTSYNYYLNKEVEFEKAQIYRDTSFSYEIKNVTTNYIALHFVPTEAVSNFWPTLIVTGA